MLHAGQLALDADVSLRALDAGPLGLDAYALPRALHAVPRALADGTIWQHIQGNIRAFLAADAANNAGHHSTPAYGGSCSACTTTATTLCPSCAEEATIFMKAQQQLPVLRAGRAQNVVYNIEPH